MTPSPALGATSEVGALQTVLFVAIVGAAAIQLRRAARNPALPGEDAETGATETVETGPKT